MLKEAYGVGLGAAVTQPTWRSGGVWGHPSQPGRSASDRLQLEPMNMYSKAAVRLEDCDPHLTRGR